MEMELHELGDGNPEARERLEAGLRKAHMKLDMLAKEIDHFERRRAQIERGRSEEMERARADGEHMRNLSRELRELQTHTRDTERRLERIDDPDSTEAHELRAGLEATRDQMGRVERELSQLRQERGASARARSERGGRRTPEDGPEREALLRQAYEGMMAQIRLTEDKLKKAEEQDRPEAAERLRLVLEQLHERREALRQEAGRLTEVPRERPGIEVEVEELRGKVDGMHEEMTEMREMLQQLLEQTRRRDPEFLEVPESTPR
jgi:chromosome segregation ATPase